MWVITRCPVIDYDSFTVTIRGQEQLQSFKILQFISVDYSWCLSLNLNGFYNFKYVNKYSSSQCSWRHSCQLLFKVISNTLSCMMVINEAFFITTSSLSENIFHQNWVWFHEKWIPIGDTCHQPVSYSVCVCVRERAVRWSLVSVFCFILRNKPFCSATVCSVCIILHCAVCVTSGLGFRALDFCKTTFLANLSGVHDLMTGLL